ncbi:hypothetical protein SPI_04382 [Niveomyces insectorum RCEF 264]|uniref:Uncharacterized protein n=1 Tax=Niveomyces insectorum RCEF 264 TaxID=1081102 RepID=A0A162J2F3_9HYPO|nr:hypothetical protein SPI_04382 [Niveomyces insectorum RCEF 264]
MAGSSPDVLDNLKSKLKSLFKRKPKTENKPAEAATEPAAAEPTKTDEAPAAAPAPAAEAAGPAEPAEPAKPAEAPAQPAAPTPG